MNLPCIHAREIHAIKEKNEVYVAAVSDALSSGSSMIEGPTKTYSLLEEALGQANEILSKEFQKIKVVWVKQLSSRRPQRDNLIESQYNQQLGLAIDGKLEEMGMVDPKTIDGEKLKASKALADEIYRQVRMHLAAKKVDGIMLFENGYKLDKRLLKQHEITIDGEGFLNINGLRLVAREKNEFWPLRAEVFRSSSISRWINEEGDIRVFDDHDLVRPDRRGMLIRLNKVHNIATEQLVARAREEGDKYPDLYYLVERDTLSDMRIEELTKILQSFPEP